MAWLALGGHNNERRKLGLRRGMHTGVRMTRGAEEKFEGTCHVATQPMLSEGLTSKSHGGPMGDHIDVRIPFNSSVATSYYETQHKMQAFATAVQETAQVANNKPQLTFT